MNLNLLLNKNSKSQDKTKKEARQEAIRKSYLIKLDLLESKYPFLLSLDKLSQILTEFFQEYYHIKYEFTSEELIIELNKKKISKEELKLIEQVLNQLKEKKYSTDSQNITEQDILKLAAEAKFLMINIDNHLA